MGKPVMDSSDNYYGKLERQKYLVSIVFQALFLLLIGIGIGYTIGFSRGNLSEQQTHKKEVDLLQQWLVASQEEDDTSYSPSYDVGYTDGYAEGYEDGEKCGFDSGCLSGEESGYSEGYFSGFYDTAIFMFDSTDDPYFKTWFVAASHGKPLSNLLEHSLNECIYYVYYLNDMPYSSDVIGELDPYTDKKILSEDDYDDYLWSLAHNYASLIPQTVTSGRFSLTPIA